MYIYIYTYVQIYIVYVYIDMDSAEIWHLKLRPLDFELCLPTNPSLAVVGVGWKRKITARSTTVKTLWCFFCFLIAMENHH